MAITNEGIKAMLDRTYNPSSDYGVPSKFSVGVGTVDADFEDTALGTQVELTTGVEEKDFVTNYPQIDLDNLSVKFRLFLNTLEANENEISEVGIWEKGNNTMFSRNTFSPQSKTSAVEISIIKADRWSRG